MAHLLGRVDRESRLLTTDLKNWSPLGVMCPLKWPELAKILQLKKNTGDALDAKALDSLLEGRMGERRDRIRKHSRDSAGFMAILLCAEMFPRSEMR